MPILKNCLYEMELLKEQRHLAFLAAYDLELSARRICVKIGRFSFGMLNMIKFLPSLNDETVLEVGCFCEAAMNAKILVGGNHRNDDLFNHNFASGRLFLLLMDDMNRALCDVAPSAPIFIGDNVVLSDGVTVTPGARIGSGSVIAAGAVVSHSLEPLGIYGGVPARLLRPRFEPDRAALYDRASFSNVAAHSLGSLPAAMMKLQTGKIAVEELKSELEFLPERPVIEMTIEPKVGSDRGIQPGAITGYRVGDRRITDESAIASLNSYFGQIHADSQKVKWTADIFDNLNLYGQR